MIFFSKQKLDEVEKYNIWALEWMNVNVLSGLMPNKQFLSYIMVKTGYISIRWWWLCPLKQQSTGRRRSTRTHFPDSEPTSLCSYSLMLHAKQRDSKYHFHKYLAWTNLGLNLPSTVLEANTLTITQLRLMR